MLSKQAVDEFKALYKKEFGEELSDSEAHEKGLRLINLIKAVYKPIPKIHKDDDSKGKRKTNQ
jgi:hypothetical protein